MRRRNPENNLPGDRMMMWKLTFAAACLLAAGSASAKDVTIEMKNQGPTGMMVFVPSFVVVDPGDTVHFVPIDKGHNAETIEGMLPTGATAAVGGMSQELVFKPSKPGLYGFKCKPHFSLGMVALVQVGRGPSPNLESARKMKLPPLAAKSMKPALDQAK